MAMALEERVRRPLLYYAISSPPSRACLMTAKLLSLELELKIINVGDHEHLKDWFKKINPRQTVPVLVDQGRNICDGHAIITYMVSQYGDDTTEYLYPTEPLHRAIIDERLYFDSGVLYQALRDFIARILYGDEVSYSEKSIALANKSYAILEQSLAGWSKYVDGGKNITVADISINTTLLSLHKLVPIDAITYPNVYAWMQLMHKELPDYEKVNESGAELLLKRITGAIVLNLRRRSGNTEAQSAQTSQASQT